MNFNYPKEKTLDERNSLIIKSQETKFYKIDPHADILVQNPPQGCGNFMEKKNKRKGQSCPAESYGA